MAQSQPLSTARLAALSDGVFAIAMTVMALELTAAVEADASVAAILLASGGKLLAFALSLLILGLFWVGQQTALRTLGEDDGENGGTSSRAHTFLNIAFLGCIALVPFPAALIGTHLDDPWSLAAYGGLLTLAAILLDLSLWQGTSAGGSARHPVARRLIRAVLSYAASVALSFANPYLGFAAFALSHIYFMLAPIQSGKA